MFPLLPGLEEDKDCQKTIRRRPEMLMMNSITASGCCDGQSKSDLEKLIYLGKKDVSLRRACWNAVATSLSAL